SGIDLFVLDEADRMLDMGFLPDVRRVLAQLPEPHQTLLFSATMPPEIRALADGILNDPVSVAVARVSAPAERVAQRLYFVDKSNKRRLLIELLAEPAISKALVFSRTKHGANRIVKELDRANIGAAAIHGNKSQGARERALAAFRDDRIRILVATDIAARGIDVEGITHVINYDLPNVAETYVHRIGRTARAGASGIALSMCDDEERDYLIDIERLIGCHIERVESHGYPAAHPPPPVTDLTSSRRPRSAGGKGRGRPHHSRARSRNGGGRGNRGRAGQRRGGGARAGAGGPRTAAGGHRAGGGGRSGRGGGGRRGGGGGGR
ncbi:MAG TPA: DEAD/DEAH box helicase, partial [Sorangium sp.]|nr:DEAD/DEAH box helicase [Sorangium sp.]